MATIKTIGEALRIDHIPVSAGFSWVAAFVDETGAPIDVTGRVYAAHVRAKGNETGTPTATFTVSAVDVVNGKVRFTLPAASCAPLVNKTWRWDVRETMPNGSINILLPGSTLTVFQDVTHP